MCASYKFLRCFNVLVQCVDIQKLTHFNIKYKNKRSSSAEYRYLNKLHVSWVNNTYVCDTQTCIQHRFQTNINALHNGVIHCAIGSLEINYKCDIAAKNSCITQLVLCLGHIVDSSKVRIARLLCCAENPFPVGLVGIARYTLCEAKHPKSEWVSPLVPTYIYAEVLLDRFFF